MAALRDSEIVAADSVIVIDPLAKISISKTCMRTGIQSTSDLFDPEARLSRVEVERLLQKLTDAARPM